MEFDLDAMKDKRAELVGTAESDLVALAQQYSVDLPALAREAVAEQLVASTIALSPPQSGGVTELRMLTMADRGTGGGTSRRPGNIRINWRQMMEDAATIALVLPVALKVEWMCVLLALRSFSRFVTAMDIKLSEQDAMVAWVLWRSIDPGNNLHSDLLVAVNAHMSANGRPTLTPQVLDACTGRLEEVMFIRRLAGERKYAVIDLVNVKYS